MRNPNSVIEGKIKAKRRIRSGQSIWRDRVNKEIPCRSTDPNRKRSLEENSLEEKTAKD